MGVFAKKIFFDLIFWVFRFVQFEINRFSKQVGWMVDQMVVVKPKAEKPTLNLDTVLFLDRGRRVLGRIFDVFGQVSEPHYCVRFNSSEHIKQSEIKAGMTVYFCPNTPYTSVVFVHDLLKYVNRSIK